jgi:two-component system, sensor histidine kinase
VSGVADGGIGSGYDREVQTELVRLHARIIRRMPWVQAILVACVGAIVFRYVPLVGLLAGCAISIGVETLRAIYASRLLRADVAFDAARSHRVFVAWALAAGAAVGVGAALCFGYLPIEDQAVLGIVLFAMPAAGVAVSQSSRYIAAAYCLSILVPATASWGRLHPGQAIAAAVMTILYCAFVILVSMEGEQLLLRSVVIRHERDRLVRDLELRNAEVGRAVERAEQAAQSRARVLATASHDLRQPLHALSIYSAVLVADPRPEQLREVGASIDQIVRSLGSLLHGLLDLSRLTVGYYQPEHAPLQLDEVVDSVCAEYRRAAAEKGLAFDVDVHPVRMMGDAVAIGRVVRNVLDNAIKYTDAGSVSVTLSRDGDTATIRIADTGAGIPADQRARIFEEFYQLDNPGRDQQHGVGLGLAIVKRLCELIDADIAVESSSDTGSIFRLTLRGMIDDAAVAQVVSGEFVPALSERRVYVIDNEADILQSTQQLLRSWGMHVSIAASVAAADALFQSSGVPDLLITDLRLRGSENGAALAARLRNEYRDFPVMVVTGEVSVAAMEQVHALGATLLYKPITPESLRRAIVKSLGAALAST